MADLPRTVQLLYDHQCPICRSYCGKVELKDKNDKLILLDARQPGLLLDEVTARGLDIDDGMVVKVDGKLHYGSDAAYELVKLKKSGLLERLVFRSSRLSRLAYPIGKFFRNITLHLLGIEKINNLAKV